MTIAFPFIRVISSPSSAVTEAILGFSVASSPKLPKHTASNEKEHLQEALQSQISMIRRFWSSGVCACDLRFVKTEQPPGIAIGLLCRLRHPAQSLPAQFRDYCL
jgi:hypothetical protein